MPRRPLASYVLVGRGAPAVPGDRKGRPYGKTVSYMFVGAVINRPRRNRFRIR